MAEENKRQLSDDNSDLRQRAEDALKHRRELDIMMPSDLKQALQESHMHKIELEMQNEELRRVQQELETSFKRYFDLYDLAPVGYVTLNGKGIVLESNLTAASLLGVERIRLVGQALSSFVYDEDHDLYYACHNQLVETQANQTCVMRMVGKTRVPFWVRIDVVAADCLDGTAGTRVAIIDIIERKLIEVALAASEERYHLLFENMTAGSAYCKMIYDNNGVPTNFLYLEINPAFGRLTGLHDVVGKKVTEVIPGIKEAHPDLFEMLAHVALTGQPENLEIEIKPLESWFAVSVYRIERDYFVTVFDNVTKRRNEELRRTLSAEILGILNDPSSINDAISHTLGAIKRETGFDAVGIRLQRGDDFPYFANEGFSSDFILSENMLSVRNEDGAVCPSANGSINLECTCGLVISGRTDPLNPVFTPRGSFWTNDSFKLLDLPVDNDPRLHARNRCIHEGFHSVALIPLIAGRRIVGILQLNDRRPNQFMPEVISFFEDLGAIIGIALARRQAEDEMKKAKEKADAMNLELESANEKLEAFSYSVSHDLRAPLRQMSGLADLLQRHLKGQSDEKSWQYSELISKSAKRMEKLIDDLLLYSRLGRKALQKTEVNLSNLLRESIYEISEETKGRDIVWKLGELPSVSCEASMLKLVFVNLISNAVKFTRIRPRAEIEMACKIGEAEVVCFVKDNGVGFAMNDADACSVYSNACIHRKNLQARE